MTLRTKTSSLDKRPSSSFYSLLFVLIIASILAFLAHPKSPLSNPAVRTINVESVFHPLDNADLLKERLGYRCQVRKPTANELLTLPDERDDWNVDRFAAYYHIHPLLKNLWVNITKDTPEEERPKVLEFGQSLFLDQFRKLLNVTGTVYPGIDIHRTPYPDNSFDMVTSDQVLEHVIYPPVAMLEMKRILKRGGLAVLTTVAYNPVHTLTNVGDYWRFMPDSLKVLSMPFEGGIKACGGWGTSEVIANRARYGLGSPTERSIFKQNRTDFLTRNEVRNVMLVWLVVEK